MTNERHEVVVSRDGASIEWWCTEAPNRPGAVIRVLNERVSIGTHDRYVDDYRTSGVTFKEVPHDMDPGLHLICRRDS